MKKYSVILLIFIITFAFSCQKEQQTTQTAIEKSSPQTALFDSAGSIKVYDPLRYLIGETDSAHSYWEITLTDIAKYHGKVCPGIATGFYMFKDVIKQLYPDTQMPIRGQVAVACSRPNDMLDVAGFVFGIRNFYGRGELGHGMLVYDTTLAPVKVPKQFVMVFKRLDNGKAVKVIFNKYNLMPQDKWQFIDSVLHAFKHHGFASGEAAEEFRNLVHNEVIHVLRNGPRKGVYEIKPCTQYKFPFEKDSDKE